MTQGENRDASDEVGAAVLLAGAVVGAVGAKNFDKIKTKAAPWMAAAGEAAGEVYTAAARRVGERIEAVQDAMAEGKRGAGPDVPSDHGPFVAAANGAPK